MKLNRTNIEHAGYSMERVEREAADNAAREYSDNVNQRAVELGLKPARGKRTLEVVEAEIERLEQERADMEEREERAAIQAESAAYDAFVAENAPMTEDDFSRYYEQAANIEYTQEDFDRAEEYRTNRENTRAEADAIIAAEEQAQGSAGERNQAGQAESRTRSTEEGFGLTRQTNAQATEEFARRQEEEGVTKEQADRERDAVPFSLAQQSQAKPQGQQGEMLTPEGRAAAQSNIPGLSDPVRDLSEASRQALYESMKDRLTRGEITLQYGQRQLAAFDEAVEAQAEAVKGGEQQGDLSQKPGKSNTSGGRVAGGDKSVPVQDGQRRLLEMAGRLVSKSPVKMDNVPITDENGTQFVENTRVFEGRLFPKDYNLWREVMGLGETFLFQPSEREAWVITKVGKYVADGRKFRVTHTLWQELAGKPEDFIPAPNGSIDYGEITPEMGKAMKRQAGKIRLERGDDTYGAQHIELRHGKDIRGVGFESVPAFVADAVSKIDAIWRPSNTSQLVVVEAEENGKVVFIELKPSDNGDYYTVNSAFPTTRSYAEKKERKEGWVKLWDRMALQPPAPAAQAPSAEQLSNDAGESAAPPSGQSASTVAPQAKESNPPAKLEDFGERLEGARKFLPPSLKEELADDQIASQPLSKIWPADAHESIEDDAAAALAFAARAEIPAKPRTTYKLKAWVEKVKTLRDMVRNPGDARLFIERGEDVRGLGNFFAKVRLLARLPREAWGRVESVGEYPNALRFDQNGKQVPMPFSTVTIDGKTHRFDGVGKIGPDEVQKAKELLGAAAPKKDGLTAADFELRRKSDGSLFIVRKGDSERRPLKTFPPVESDRNTVKDAHQFLKDNVPALEAEWESVKARDNVSKADMRRDTNRERQGKDWRNGKDVTPEMFQEALGFRGTQFGEWVGQGAGAKQRQGLLNEAFDALHDLSDLLGIHSRAISLNGTLGLSLGARGKGRAAAHYEPDTLVINLTKTKGAGSLAHEWFHALDNYFSRMRGESASNERKDNFITYATEPSWVKKGGTYSPSRTSTQLRDHLSKLPSFDPAKTLEQNAEAAGWERDPKHKAGVRPEVERAFAHLVDVLNESPMAKRASVLDKGVSQGYWGRIIERGARSFENYVVSKMALRGQSNDFLANIRNWQEWESLGKNQDRYPYLRPEEEAPVIAAFDELFETVETRQGDDGNVAIRSASEGGPLPESKWLSESAITQVVEERLAQFRHQPPVLIRDSERDVLGDRALDDGVVVSGMAYRGKVHLFREGLVDTSAVARTLFHELLHYGLRNFLTRSQYIVHLNTLYQNDGWVRKRADEWLATPEADEAKKQGAAYARARGVDEALARLAEVNEGEYRNNGMLARAYRAVADFVAKLAERMGFKDVAARWRGVSNTEARDLVRATFQKLRDDAPAVSSDWAFNADPSFMVAWHGTPHRGIEKTGFKLNKIGTGEGAQAYGWGLYFASQREVAESYRRGLTSGLSVAGYDSESAAAYANRLVKHWGGEEAAKNVLTNNGEDQPTGRRLEFLRAIEDGSYKIAEIEENPGQLYRAEIPEDSDLLDWDKPLSEQPAKVREAVQRIKRGMPSEMRWMLNGLTPQTAGRTLYGTLGDLAAEMNPDGVDNIQQAASELLRENGVPGLRYLDGDSRANGDGSANYVIWDEALLTPEKANIKALYSRSDSSIPLPTSGRIASTTIADEVERRIGQFAHHPPVLIRDSADGVLPDATSDDGIAGAVFGGRIYLFRDHLASRADVQRTLFHELLHYGLRRFMGREQYIEQMLRLAGRDAYLMAEAERWAASEDGKRAHDFGGEDYAFARGVDEALAQLAEPNAGVYLRDGIGERIVRAVTRWAADLAASMGMKEVAARIRSWKNQEAREFIQSVFRRLETDAAPVSDAWGFTADPAFMSDKRWGALSAAEKKVLLETFRYSVTKKALSKLIADGAVRAENRAVAREFVDASHALRDQRLQNRPVNRWYGAQGLRDRLASKRRSGALVVDQEAARKRHAKVLEHVTSLGWTAEEAMDVFQWDNRHDVTDAGAQVTVLALTRAAQARGWELDHSSQKGGGESAYLMKDGVLVRVSDHDLPMTPEREYNHSIGLMGRWNREVVTREWRSTSLDEYLAEIEGTTDEDDGGSMYSRDDAAKLAAADKAVYGLAAEGKTTREVLNFIASASRSPFNRQLARLLLKTGINPTITVGDAKGWKFNAGDGKSYAAAYNPKADAVTLFRPSNAERHMLHELVHAATVNALQGKGLPSIQLRALFNHVKKTGKLKGKYGMENIDEFMAEVFTNPKFQEDLKKIAAPAGSTAKGAWDWFVRIVRNILGLPANQDSALSRALEIGVGVMREDMKLRSGRKTLAMTSMRKYPGTTDFETIKNRIVPSYAQSDAGDVRIVYPDKVGRQEDDAIRYSLADTGRSAAQKVLDAGDAAIAKLDGWLDRETRIPDGWTAQQKAAAGKFATFSPKQPVKSMLRGINDRMKDRAAQLIFDQFRPLKNLSEDAFMLAHLSKATDGALEAVATLGIPVLRDGALAVEKQDDGGFIGALVKSLGNAQEVNQFLMWVAANRAEALSKEWIVRRDNGLVERFKTEAEARAAVKNWPSARVESASRENLFSPGDIAAMKEFAKGRLADGTSRTLAYRRQCRGRRVIY